MGLKKIINKLRKYKIRKRVDKAIRSGMKVGDSFVCGGNVEFGSEPYLISIGNHVQLSGNVIFVTHDGATWVFRDNLESCKDLTKYGPIKICDNCFIGNRAIILPGVKIGPNTVVAAGSVVAKNAPKDTIVAGSPAKPIMTYDEYVKKCMDLDQRVEPKNKKQILLKMFENYHF